MKISVLLFRTVRVNNSLVPQVLFFSTILRYLIWVFPFSTTQLLPLHLIYLINLVSSYFAESDHSVCMGYSLWHINNKILWHWVKGVAFPPNTSKWKMLNIGSYSQPGLIISLPSPYPLNSTSTCNWLIFKSFNCPLFHLSWITSKNTMAYPNLNLLNLTTE